VSETLAAAHGLTFPLASDPTHTTIDAYGVLDAENEIAWPAVYLVERDGTVSWRFLGDSYQERPTSDELRRAIDRT
jgi:peroxiredoxin